MKCYVFHRMWVILTEWKKKIAKAEDAKEEKKKEKKCTFKSRFNESRILLMDLKRLRRRRKKKEYIFTIYSFFPFLSSCPKFPPRPSCPGRGLNFFPIILLKKKQLFIIFPET